VGEPSLKILCTAPYFWPRIGGMENFAFDLVTHLHDLFHHETVTISSSWDRIARKKSIPGPTQIVQLPFLFKISTTPIGLGWKRKIRRAIQQFQPDVIISHTPVPYMADVTAAASIREGVPLVLFYYNDLEPISKFTRTASIVYQNIWEPNLLRRATRIVTLSTRYAQESRWLRPYLAKVATLPPGVDRNRFRPTTPGFLRHRFRIGDEPLVLFVGQLETAASHKGIETLFAALRIAAARLQAVHLVVVGKGSARTALVHLAKRYGLNDRVHFAGFLSARELPAAYTEATVVVLPSVTRSEGFGLVLLEAQACGTPVIGSAIGGIPDAIDDGVSGLLVSPGNAEALASAIVTVCDDKDLRNKLGHAGMNFVKLRHSVEASTAIANKLLTDVVSP